MTGLIIAVSQIIIKLRAYITGVLDLLEYLHGLLIITGIIRLHTEGKVIGSVRRKTCGKKYKKNCSEQDYLIFHFTRFPSFSAATIHFAACSNNSPADS